MPPTAEHVRAAVRPDALPSLMDGRPGDAAEPATLRLLADLDPSGRPPPARTAWRRHAAWGAVPVALLAVAAGLWTAGRPDTPSSRQGGESPAAWRTAAVAPDGMPPAAVPPTGPKSATTSPPAQTPAPPVARNAPARVEEVVPAPSARSAAPPPAVVRPPAPVPSTGTRHAAPAAAGSAVAAAKPPPSPPAPARTPPSKAVAAGSAPVRTAVAPRHRPAAATPASTGQDTDVVLLSALLAHLSRDGPEGPPPVAAQSPTALAQQVRRCDALTGGRDGRPARACRRRVCDGHEGRADACPAASPVGPGSQG